MTLEMSLQMTITPHCSFKFPYTLRICAFINMCFCNIEFISIRMGGVFTLYCNIKILCKNIVINLFEIMQVVNRAEINMIASKI